MSFIAHTGTGRRRLKSDEDITHMNRDNTNTYK